MENVFIEKIRKFKDITPNKIAFSYLERGLIKDSITYKEVYNKYVEYTEYLKKLKLENKLYVLYLSAGVDFVPILFSCIKNNIKVVIKTIGETVSSEKLIYQLTELKSDIKDIEGIITNFDYNSFEEKCIDMNLNYINITKKYNNIKYNPTKSNIKEELIILTSGSTKSSKGVLIDSRGLELNVKECINFWNITDKDICLNWMPHSHIYGLVTGFLMPIYSGSTSFIMSPKEYSNDFDLFFTCLSKYKITHTHTPASNMFLEKGYDFLKNNQDEKFTLKNLRAVSLGGEGIKYDLLEKFYSLAKKFEFKKIAFSPNYGMSEITGLLCAIKSDEELCVVDINELFLKDSNIKNTPNNLISVGKVDDKVIICEPNTFNKLESLKVGEIIINVPSIASGYINCLEDNESFVKYNGKRCFRTGDLGFLYNGYLIITGRIKELIKISGKNISPYELENIIVSNSNLEFIKSVVVFGKRNIEDYIEEIGVFIEVDDNKKLNVNELKKIIIRSVNDKLQIKIKKENILILRKNKIPRFSNGKVSRKKCNELFDIFKEDENEKG